MERNVILANVASMTAEQLFDEIKGGNVTLDELMKTGNLDVTKRKKIDSLQQQLDSIDNEDWERARNYQLLIGTRERRVPENECGIMRLYDVPNLMGDLVKKKEYKKLGKIVDIVYKERKK